MILSKLEQTVNFDSLLIFVSGYHYICAIIFIVTHKYIVNLFKKTNLKFKIMKIAVFGTGSVGQTLATRLAGLAHNVSMGTRNVENSLVRDTKDFYGTPTVTEFLKANPSITLKTYADAAIGAEIIVLATKGDGAQAALEAAGNIDGKIILDISNPLDFSKGFPPTLFVSNDNSLGEVLQAAFPNTHVVKTLNTMWAGLMVNPRMIEEDHTVFVSGNDADAKATAKGILSTFGWRESEILDLGDITTARGSESVLPIWLRIFNAKQNGAFNFKIVMPTQA
jgi:8-hydroxy-5-deazaflavin:NADPH oxidoreductase